MNKLYVCIYLLPLETSSHPPSIPPHWVITEHWAELHALYSSFLLASYFTHGSVYVYVCMYVYVCICVYMYVYVYVNATLSICPTLSFPLPGKSHGQRSLVGYSPWGHRIRHDWATSLSLSPSPAVSRRLFSISVSLFLPSEKAMAAHSSTLAWKISWTEEPGRLQSTGSLRVGHDWVTSLSLFTFMHWRRKRQPTPVFLPGESQGWRSLVGCRLWGRRVEHDWNNLAAAFLPCK